MTVDFADRPYRARHRKRLTTRVAEAWSRAILRWNGVRVP